MEKTPAVSVRGKEEEAPKEYRQRKKRLLQQIADQMEFYFSAANVTKDRFMNSLLNRSPYIELQTFFKFNRIRSMTDDLDFLKKAIKKSSILELSEDGLKVRRKTDIEVKENDVQCTIYVEHIPSHVDHDWVRQVFAQYGTIDYISLPRYRRSGRPKGFAFVEFKTPEMANSALEAFGALECKISSTIDPAQLQSIQTYEGDRAEEHIDKTQGSGLEMETGDVKNTEVDTEEEGKGKKRKVEDDACEGTKEKKRKVEKVEKSDKSPPQEEEETEENKTKVDKDEKSDTSKSPPQEEEETKAKIRKVEKVERSDNSPPQEEEGTKEKKRKVDKVERSDKSPPQEEEGTKEKKRKVDKVERSDKSPLQKEEGAKEKKRKVETVERSDKSPPQEEEGTKEKIRKVDKVEWSDKSPPQEEEGTKEKKRKVDEVERSDKSPPQEEENMDQSVSGEQQDTVEGEEEPSAGGKNKKKKKRKRNKKEKEEVVDSIYLKVMSKEDWKKLRNKYLNTQRENMKALKMQLQERHDQHHHHHQHSSHMRHCGEWNANHPDDAQEKTVEEGVAPKSQSLKPQFTPNSVIKISFEEPPQDPKKLRETIREGGGGGVAYVDVSATEKNVFVRFLSEEAATAYKKTGCWTRMEVLAGTEEEEYWQRISTCWMQRRNQRNKRDGKRQQSFPGELRGREKLLQKAFREAQNTKCNTHIVFDD